MLNSWSRQVCTELLRDAPYLADLFVRIPAVIHPDVTDCILSLKEGHPQFLISSHLQFSPATTARVYHHLLHMLFQHDRFDRTHDGDQALHLAMDTIVNQEIPSRWQPFLPTCRLPDQFPSTPNLYQAWRWWTVHPDRIQPCHLLAIEEHHYWRYQPSSNSPLPPPIQSTWPLPARWKQIQDEDRALQEGLTWQNRLLQHNSKTTATHLTWTTRKASRRYGTQPGIRIRSRGDLAIILDTSGSMTDMDIHAFFSFLPQMQQFYRHIRIIESDHIVRKVYSYSGQKPDSISGRSDTSFQPALDFVIRNEHPDVIWYVTDGNAIPPRYSASIPLYWVLCGDRADEAHLSRLPGIRILMNHRPMLDVHFL